MQIQVSPHCHLCNKLNFVCLFVLEKNPRASKEENESFHRKNVGFFAGDKTSIRLGGLVLWLIAQCAVAESNHYLITDLPTGVTA